MGEGVNHKAKKSKKEKKRNFPSEETLTEMHVQKVENPCTGTQSQLHVKKQEKGLKSKHNSIASSEDATPTYLGEPLEAEKSEEKKKKKKHKKDKFLEDEQNSISSMRALDETSSRKKKKKYNEENSPQATEKPNKDVTEEIGSKKTKKHKKKQTQESDSKSELRDNHDDTLNTSGTKMKSLPDDIRKSENTEKKKKEKHEEHDETNNGENVSISLKDKKSKKKKRKREQDDVSDVKEVCCEENTVSLDEIKPKKIKKKNFKGIKSEGKTFSDEKNELKLCKSECETGENQINLNGNDKRKKSKRSKSTPDVGSEEAHQNEKYVAVKKNCTELVTSPSQTSAKDQSQSTHVVGQWQGDLFGSTERQNKFLRLLGGMKKNCGKDSAKRSTLFKSQADAPKKSLFGSLVSRAGGGSALSVSDAANLNQKLEEDYNRALDLKLSKKRGTGFGFVPDPAEGKKFHIDVNKTNSIKFDD